MYVCFPLPTQTNILYLLDPTILLLSPHTERLAVTPQLKNKIIKYLATAFPVRGNIVRNYIPESLEQWGRMRMTNGGDLIHARGYHTLRPDGRDASFVRVSTFCPLKHDFIELRPG